MIFSVTNQLLVELEPCNYEGFVIWIPNLKDMDRGLNREVVVYS